MSALGIVPVVVVAALIALIAILSLRRRRAAGGLRAGHPPFAR